MTIGAGHKQIGQLLLQAGVIDDLQLRSALGHQRQWGGRLGRILVELKFLDENTLAATLARQLGLESTRITGESVDPKVVALVPQTVAERYWIFPLSFKDSKGGGELTVAVSDPTNLASVEDVRFHTGKRIKVVVAPESDIEGAIKRFYYGDAGAMLAVSPAGEEVFASSPTSMGEPEPEPQPEEDLIELEPIPTESIPAASPPGIAGGDALDDFFDGLTPPPVSGADALFDFPAPESASTTSPTRPPPNPPSIVLDAAALGGPLLDREAPTPLRVDASAFDGPQAAALFDPGPAEAQPVQVAETAPFIGEEEVYADPAGIPLKTQPVITLIPTQALAAPYPEAAEPEEVVSVFGSAAAADASPEPPPESEPAFAVDLLVDVDSDSRNEGAPFAALAPPLVGAAAAPPAPEIVAPPVEPVAPVAPGVTGALAAIDASPVIPEAPPTESQAAPTAPSAPAPPQASSFDEPPRAVVADPTATSGPLGEGPFTEGELQILDTLEARVAGGTEPAQVIKPGQLVSALIRLMIRKGLLAEAELIEELQKH